MYAYFILCYVFIYVICYKTVLIWSIGLICHALLEPHLFTFYSLLTSKIGRYSFPDKIYLFKVNKKKHRKKNWYCWHRFAIFILNFEYVSYLFSVLLLLDLNRKMFPNLQKSCVTRCKVTYNWIHLVRSSLQTVLKVVNYFHKKLHLRCQTGIRIHFRMNTITEIPLTHFIPLLFYYITWKYCYPKGFLMFSGGKERDQWYEMV